MKMCNTQGNASASAMPLTGCKSTATCRVTPQSFLPRANAHPPTCLEGIHHMLRAHNTGHRLKQYCVATFIIESPHYA
jgi:hypothetical protein